MFEIRMNDEAEKIFPKHKPPFDESTKLGREVLLNVYKGGYTAALSDLQGKVDGLLEALQRYIDESKHWPIVDDKYDKGERYSDIARDAIAEFKNGSVK